MEKIRPFYCYIILLVLLAACSNRYEPFRSKYPFKSADGRPDYTDLDYWAAHPGKWDPSDSIPAPLLNEPRDTLADVFFLHPTTYTSQRRKKEQNAGIDDDFTNAKTDYSTILYQASVFNQQCRVFAPRYRQAHITSFFMKNKERADDAFALAYQDLRTAFQYYLEHWNKGRPIIIAGHSQGSLMAEKLLKEFFEDKPLKNKLVAAYIIGWPVPKEYFSSLKVCEDPLQTGCICSWRTYRNGFVPFYLKKENGNSYVTNPLSWTTGNEYVSKDRNTGSVLVKFNKVFPQSTGAQISNGLLYISKPKFPGSFFYFTRNYHIGDINLFYLNLRANIRQRVNSFMTEKR